MLTSGHLLRFELPIRADLEVNSQKLLRHHAPWQILASDDALVPLLIPSLTQHGVKPWHLNLLYADRRLRNHILKCGMFKADSPQYSQIHTMGIPRPSIYPLGGGALVAQPHKLRAFVC